MRYVAVPVEFWRVDFPFGNTRVLCHTTLISGDRGEGSTEDEAFADLLTKLGYREALSVRGDNYDMMQFFNRCVEGYDADDVAQGLREFLDEYHKLNGDNKEG